MVEYIGNRRTDAPASGAPLPAFAEDDEGLTCPKCGAAVRETQDWCTLCLHVLHPAVPLVPPPAPPAPLASAAPAPQPTGRSEEPGDPDGADAPSGLDAEAAAEALLAQLAIDTRRQSFSVPAFLNSKSRIAVFVTVAMSALSGALLALMGVLGKLFG